MKNLRHLLRRVTSNTSRKSREDRSRGQRLQKRRLLSQTLESRNLLAGDVGVANESPVAGEPGFAEQHNYWLAYDVDNNFRVTAADALQVINYLNREAQGESTGDGDFAGYVDVNADQRVTAADALMVINALNDGQGEDTVPDLVGFRLNPRQFNDGSGDGDLLTSTGTTSIDMFDNVPVYEVAQGDIFFLEVSVADLRGRALAEGVFRAVSDIVVSQADVLEPAVGEIDQVVFDNAILDTENLNGNVTLQFAGSTPVTVDVDTLLGNNDAQAAAAMANAIVQASPLVNSVDELRVTAAINSSAGTYEYTIEYNSPNLIGVSVPALTVTVSDTPSNIATNVVAQNMTLNDGSFNSVLLTRRYELETQFEYQLLAEQVNGDDSPTQSELSALPGSLLDNSAGVWGQDRTVGTFAEDVVVDGNTVDVFDEVGGLGPVGRLSTFLPDFATDLYFDFVSIPVRAKTVASNVYVELEGVPEGDTDGVLIYGQNPDDDKSNVPVNAMRLDNLSRFVLNVEGTVTGVNAQDASLTVLEDDTDGEMVTVQATSTDTISYSLVDTAQNGTATIDSTSGVFTYIPNADFFGTETIRYRAAAGSSEDTATVTVTVSPVNDAPIANDDPGTGAAITVDVGDSVTISVLDNDSAGPGEPISELTVSQVAGSGPSEGTISVVNNQIIYTPNGNTTATSDQFDYQISDGEFSDTATVSVTIVSNRAIIALNAGPISVPEDLAGLAGNPTEVMVADLDDLVTERIDNGPLVYSISSVINPSGNNQATARVDAATGEVFFTPAPDDDGEALIIYTASNAAGTDDDASATITIDLTPVNDAPVAPEFTTIRVNERSSFSLNVLQNDSTLPEVTDVDNDSSELTVSVVQSSVPAGLTVSVVNNIIVITSTTAADDVARAFTYRVTDPGGLSDENVINVVVDDVLDPPDAMDTNLVVNEDATTGLTVDLGALTTVEGGDTATFSVVSQASNLGTATINGDQLTLALNANANGTGQIVYQATGGNGSDQATIFVTVNPENDAPTITSPIARNVQEDGVLNIDVAALGSDIDNDPLTASVATQPTNGVASNNTDGTIRYVPNANYTGPDSFQVEISDGNGGTATTTINVNVTDVIAPPVASDGSLSVNEDSTATIDLATLVSVDPGDTFTVAVTGQPTNGNATINGTVLTYTPSPDFNGLDSLTYTASNGGGSDTGTINITVASVNDAPVAANDTAVATVGGSVTIDVLDNDTLEPGETATLSVVSGPSQGTLSLNANNEFVYQASATASGTDTFTYSLSDGTLSDTATVTITIRAGQATITGQLFIDSMTNFNEVLAGTESPNFNGQLDQGEQAFVGVEVQLVRPAAGGSPEAVVATDMTDATGTYVFNNLDQGEYEVRFTLPGGTSGADSVTVTQDQADNGGGPAANVGLGSFQDTTPDDGSGQTGRGTNILVTAEQIRALINAGSPNTVTAQFNLGADGSSFSPQLTGLTLEEDDLLGFSLSASGTTALVSFVEDVNAANPVVLTAEITDQFFSLSEDGTMAILSGDPTQLNFVENFNVDANQYPDYAAAIDEILSDFSS